MQPYINVVIGFCSSKMSESDYDDFADKCTTGDCPRIDSYWEDGGYGESAIVMEELVRPDFNDKVFDLRNMYSDIGHALSFKKAEAKLRIMGFEKYTKDLRVICYVTEY